MVLADVQEGSDKTGSSITISPQLWTYSKEMVEDKWVDPTTISSLSAISSLC